MVKTNTQPATLLEQPDEVRTGALERASGNEAAPASRPSTNAPSDILLMIERLAVNPDFGVEKLEKLIDMQERILDRNAASAFNIAFAKMQPKIPTIIERKSTDRGKYAPREDIVEVIRPILSEYGFSLSFRTEWPEKTVVKVVGILTHEEGHSRQSEFMSAADTSGSKNAVQALGSAVEYGRRYTTTDLLNIASRGGDDDATKSGRPEPPEGFEAWFIDMEAVAPEGLAKLQDAWNKSSKAFKEFATKHYRDQWEAMKRKARAVQS